MPLLALLIPAAAAAQPLSVQGTLSDVDGGPLAAQVELIALPSDAENERQLLAGRVPGEASATARSDGDGRFHLTAPGPGVYRVLATAPGRVAMTWPLLTLTAATELPRVVLPRDAGGRIRVIDRAEAPVAGVAVWADAATPERWRDFESDGWQPQPRLGWSGEDGSLAVARLAGERLVLRAWVPGATAPQRAEMVDRATVVVDPVVEPGREIEVRDERGVAVAGVVLATGRRIWPFVATGDDGRARIPAVGTPESKVYLFAGDGRFAVDKVEPLAGEESQDADSDPDIPTVLVLPDLATVAGEVRDARTGAPLPGALVWPANGPARFALADRDGRFTVQVPPAASVRLNAAAAGYLATGRAVDLAGRRGTAVLDLVPGMTLAGTVRDTSGAPLAAVRLTALRARDDGAPPERLDGVAVSDAAGRFTLAGLSPADSYVVSAEKDGFTTADQTVPGLGPGESRDELEIVLHRGRGGHGRVVDLDDRPLAGAEVWLRPAGVLVTAAEARRLARDRARQSEGKDDPFYAVTDEQGRFGIRDLPDGQVDILARRPGFAPLLVRGVSLPPGRRDVDLGTLLLEPGAQLAGRVAVADRADEPIAGARVRVGDSHDRSSAWRLAADDTPPDAVSGNDGRFLIADLAPGSPVDLRVDADGFLPATESGVAVPRVEPLTVEMRPAATVRGRVENAAGEPLAGATVTIESRDGSREPGTDRSVATDAQGRFELAQLSPGTVVLTARADGFQPSADVEVAARAGHVTDGVVLVLERGATLEGWVTARDGAPIAGATVLVDGASGTSGESGDYRVTGIVPGVRQVEVRHPQYNRARREIEIDLDGAYADFELDGGHPVAGRVVDPQQRPVPGARVALEASGDEPHLYDAVTGGDGAFTLPGVADGHYRVRATKHGYAPAELAGGLPVAGEGVEGVEIELTTGGVISGQLLGLEPEEVAAVRVEAIAVAGGRFHGTVDYAGQYEVPDLAPGDWRVRAWLPGNSRQAEARVVLSPDAGRVERDLEFGTGVTLTGVVLHGSEPLAGAALRVRGFDVAADRSVVTDREGRFRVADLGPGRYRLELSSAASGLVHNEDLTLFEDTDVTIQVDTVRLSGTVTTADGEPLAAALILLRQLLPGGAEGSLYTVGTEADGSFVLDNLTAGRYRLTAQHNGYQPHEELLDLPPGAAIDGRRIVLTPTAGLEVVARISNGTTPRYLTLVAFGPGGGRVLTETRVLDDDGYALFATCPQGDWTVLAAAPGSATLTTTVSVPGDPAVLILPAASRLNVRVPALVESQRVATLTVHDTEGRSFTHLAFDGEIQRTWPIVGGNATIEGVPAGLWQVTATAPDGASWTATVVTTGGPDVAVNLE